MISLEKVKQRAESDAQSHGYYLNSDPEFLKNLLEGLKQNEERYGYPSCPCRLASGKFRFDRDIICPCDYRDPDIEEYGCCYCALYVSKDVFEGKASTQPIPERRPLEKQTSAHVDSTGVPEKKRSERIATLIETPAEIRLKMLYCRQCGYVCFREGSPYVCPICKAKKEMFAEIAIRTDVYG